MRRRETIHLSFGPTANAVTSHLLNLEGLAITSPTTTADGLSTRNICCEPMITHRRDNANQVWIPRVLLVDESHRLHPNYHPTTNIAAQEDPSAALSTTTTTTTPLDTSVAASTWNGVVQPFNVGGGAGGFSLENFFTNADEANVVANLSYNSNNLTTTTTTTKPSTRANNNTAWLSSWHETSSRLAYAPYSQYRLSASEQTDYYYSVSSASESRRQAQEQEQESRHVNWDDLGDEQEEEDEFEKQRTAQRLEQQRRTQLLQWEEERNQYQQQMDNVWNQPQTATEEPNGSQQRQHQPSESDLHNLSWMDYWMPPHPTPLSQCTYGLPSTSSSSTGVGSSSSADAPPLYSFNYNNYSKDLLDELWERIRIELERTDSCQGFTILTEGCGIYAGMSDWLLQELQQECRSAGRWVFHVHQQHEDEADYNNNNALSNENDENVFTQQQPPSTELARAQAKVRDNVQRGLALAGMTDHANVVVPLQLPSKRGKSLFRASAELALALESATLPYRSSSSNSTLVGWNSMSGYEEGMTPTGNMSLGDYLTTLQPSPRYCLLELDTVAVTPQRVSSLGRFLAAGTSVERDPRMRRPPTSRSAGTMEYPGSWLLDEKFVGSSSSSTGSGGDGILTCLSPGHVANQDRSLHHHFGLSTCLRRSSSQSDGGGEVMGDNDQNYLTCLMEGMGIRYRPETAFGLVTDQSLTKLTTPSSSGGHRYGAGSYWQHLLGGGGSSATDIPVLSVLGNTTRMYPYLHGVSNQLKNALKSSKNKGYYQREVINGTLPELDDCDESLEQCLNLRDTYEPPNGSGLDAGDGEHYFD